MTIEELIAFVDKCASDDTVLCGGGDGPALTFGVLRRLLAVSKAAIDWRSAPFRAPLPTYGGAVDALIAELESLG